jgi:predicted flap endonuclease-1-like 5' DNA nuclease
MQSDGQSNQSVAGASDPSLEGLDMAEGVDPVALQAEVLKWQERVPKLAAALRERTEELAAVRDELRRANSSGQAESEPAETSDVRLKARDELIAELQQKVDDVGAQHRDAASELHATQLDLQRATEEAQTWRAKWQDVTSSLDTSVADASRTSNELAQARSEWDDKQKSLAQDFESQLQKAQRNAESLKSRNANLQETIEFANKQIASLSEDMTGLVQQASDSENAASESAARIEQLQVEIANESERYNSAMQAANDEQTQLSAALEAKDASIAEWQRRHDDESEAARKLESDLAQARHALQEADERQRTAESARDAALAKASSDGTIASEQTQSLQSALQAAQEQCLEAEQARSVQAAEVSELTAQRDAATSAREDLQTQLQSMREDSTRAQQALTEEVERLTECVSNAQASQAQGQDERRDLADRAAALGRENARLQASLDERSALVCELESEREQRGKNDADVAADKQRSDAALSQAEQKLETFQEHARGLEAKVQTQQALLSELEGELSDAQMQSQASLKAAEQAARENAEIKRVSEERTTKLQHKCDDLSTRNGELLEQANERARTIDELNAQVAELADAPDDSNTLDARELEQVLRERTEELDALRWRLEQSEAAVDENVVMVLNQQLTDAQEENKRLREKIASAIAAPAESATPEDLTEIRGIGAKLAQRLTALGFTTLAQIAALELNALNSADHPLHAFKNRMQRDEWIKQAKKLVKARL